MIKDSSFVKSESSETTQEKQAEKFPEPSYQLWNRARILGRNCGHRWASLCDLDTLAIPNREPSNTGDSIMDTQDEGGSLKELQDEQTFSNWPEELKNLYINIRNKLFENEYTFEYTPRMALRNLCQQSQGFIGK